MKSFALITLLWSTTALGAAHPRVQLEVDACVGDSAEIRRVVLVELGELLADGPDVDGNRTHASATCDGPLAILRVDDPITRKSMSRGIELGRTYPRTLALALVELISASWTELAPAEAPPPSLVEPHVVAQPLASWRVRVAVDASAIRFSDLHVLSGFGGRISDASGARLGWMVDLHVVNGLQSVDTDEVSAKLIDGAAAVLLHHTWSDVRVDAGAGVRGGAAELAGIAKNLAMPLQASSFWGRWFGPFVTGGGSLTLAGRLTFDASIETGYVLSPVSALVDGHHGVAVSGPWVAGHLGFGVKL